MGHSDPLLQILILLTASVCVVAAVRKLALPAILGYLAVGMLLGPHALSLAADNETTQLLADFGVVFLVFTLGLEFSLPRLVAMRWEVLGVGGAQVLITTGIVASGAGNPQNPCQSCQPGSSTSSWTVESIRRRCSCCP